MADRPRRLARARGRTGSPAVAHGRRSWRRRLTRLRSASQSWRRSPATRDSPYRQSDPSPLAPHFGARDRRFDPLVVAEMAWSQPPRGQIGDHQHPRSGWPRRLGVERGRIEAVFTIEPARGRATARSEPALALFALLCHGRDANVELAVPAVAEALRALGPKKGLLDDEIILAGLPEALWTRWEAYMTSTMVREYRSRPTPWIGPSAAWVGGPLAGRRWCTGGYGQVRDLPGTTRAAPRTRLPANNRSIWSSAFSRRSRASSSRTSSGGLPCGPAAGGPSRGHLARSPPGWRVLTPAGVRSRRRMTTWRSRASRRPVSARSRLIGR
jgi:hypothetical protein